MTWKKVSLYNINKVLLYDIKKVWLYDIKKMSLYDMKNVSLFDMKKGVTLWYKMVRLYDIKKLEIQRTKFKFSSKKIISLLLIPVSLSQKHSPFLVYA